MSQIAETEIDVDAYRTTGTSPTLPSRHVAPARRGRARGAYERIHLLGPGAVGRELLKLIARDRRRLVAVTDSSGTIAAESGIDPLAVVDWKARGLPLRTHPLALRSDGREAIDLVDADVLVDTTSSDPSRPGWTAVLDAALERDACLISAAKTALCAAGPEWLAGRHRARVGCNAVLGGTGRSFLGELDDLHGRVHSIAIVGNASTTAILEAIERGSSVDEGIAEAGRRGFLEPDPELDLRGADAAVKLAIVAGILTGRRIDPLAIPCDDIRAVDPLTVRARAQHDRTTRLVARWRAGGLSVRYEELGRDSLLAAPCGRVVYEYGLPRGERRLHIGSGLGAAATAAAVWSDLRRIPRLAAGSTSAGGAR